MVTRYLSCGSLFPTLALVLLCACSGKQEERMDTGDGPGERGYDESCSTLNLTSIGGMEIPWSATIALGHQDCESPDLVVFCDAEGPVVESGEVEVLSCSDQAIELRGAPEEVCVYWESEVSFCAGKEWGEPVYTVVSAAGDLDCVEGAFTVQACD